MVSLNMYSTHVHEGGEGLIKRISKITVVTVVAILFCLSFAALCSADSEATTTISIDGLEYSISASGDEVTVTGYVDGPSGALTIPDTITYEGREYSVTSIGGYAFSYYEDITGLTIPASVTSIGEGAFMHCSGLVNLTIGANVETIGDNAFYSCSGITGTIGIPASVTSIGEGAFSWCGGSGFIVDADNPRYMSSDGITTQQGLLLSKDGIEASVVAGLIGITGSLTIPEKITDDGTEYTVTSIGESAFIHCSGITGTIGIPASVTFIGESAFFICGGSGFDVAADNANYSSANGLLLSKDGKTLIAGLTGMEDVIIPDTVEIIGDSAFSSCDSIVSLDIPASVTTIGWHAFAECSSITSLTIPDSVETIESFAFADCSGIVDLTIGANVKYIWSFAFDCCSSITSLTIPDSVETIGIYAFSECTGITGTIGIPASVTSIEGGAFFICGGSGFDVAADNANYSSANGFLLSKDGKTLISGLMGMEEAIIPDTVEIIESAAFDSCMSITGTIEIPASVTSIGNNAFFICGGSGFDVAADNANYSSANGLLLSKDGKTLIAGLTGMEDVIIPDTVETIGSWAFYCCENITSLTIPASVTCIEKGAFLECTNLTEIIFESVPSTIGWSAFALGTSDHPVKCTVKGVSQGLLDDYKNGHTEFSYPSKHMVTYDVCGGSGAVPASKLVYEGDVFIVADYAGTKDGYDFGGWSYDGSTYAVGQEVIMGASDMVLSAVWESDSILNTTTLVIIAIVVLIGVAAVVLFVRRRP